MSKYILRFVKGIKRVTYVFSQGQYSLFHLNAHVIKIIVYLQMEGWMDGWIKSIFFRGRTGTEEAMSILKTTLNVTEVYRVENAIFFLSKMFVGMKV